MANGTGVKLEGAEDLLKELQRFGPAVANRAGNKGMREALKDLRREFRAVAPTGGTGHLRSALVFRYRARSKSGWVGLGPSGAKFRGGSRKGKIPYYYKTLEFRSARGAAMHPFMEKAWNRVRERVARMLIRETKAAVTEEALVAYARSKRRRS